MKKQLKLYNTLSRTKELFVPINEDIVTMYTCGPTVYNYAHIGNLRSYIFPDILKKVLKLAGYNVKQIMNFTDVGHNTTDEDFGEDKVEKAAAEKGTNAWELSKYYAEAFKRDISLLNITFPSKFTYATEYIKEQINMVKTLEEKGFTYLTSDGVYFDTAKFNDYGKMAKLDIEGLNEGQRVDFKEKRNKTDFALWKLSPTDKKRQMEWDSPWGVGFPGWHIECSAMVFAELGEHIDIHSGGTDHIQIHHTNEIAQSECCSGKKFVNYWLHGAFLVLETIKMAKSGRNFITLQTIIDAGFNPLAYRYLALTSHYRNFLTFSNDILKSAQNAYFNLKKAVRNISTKEDEFGNDIQLAFDKEILDSLLDDLNVPKAIGFFWEMIGSDKLGNKNKIELIKKYDDIFSLNLFDFSDLDEKIEVPEEILLLAEERWTARKNKDWKESDRIRALIHEKGFDVKDSKDSYEIIKR
ncbi:MAG: cysteine--tRNA ligase [Candidatus Sericytochromatia bacterium]